MEGSAGDFEYCATEATQELVNVTLPKGVTLQVLGPDSPKQ